MRQKHMIMRPGGIPVGVLLLALASLVLGAAPASGAPRTGGESARQQDAGTQGVRVFTGSGFDTCHTPAQSTMEAWRESPYRAVGVYFGGRGRACPQQPNLTPDWVRNVDRMGWRLLPLYVGSQAPCVTAENKRHVPIDSADPRGQGTREGADAVQRAKDLGLKPDSPLYLDMEAYRYQESECARVTLAFVQAWNHEVSRQGYLPGYYSSASSGISHMEQARRAGQTDLPQVIWFARWNVAPSVNDEPSLHPDAWQPHRRIHQYAGNVTETHGGQTLTIDRNQVDAPVAVTG